jgi:hypothetical protein
VNMAARLCTKVGDCKKRGEIVERVGSLRQAKKSLKSKLKRVILGVFFVEVLKKSS